MRTLAALLAVLCPLAPPPPVQYFPPVDAPVTDWFRPPPEPWSAGNRGLEYDTEPGQPVRAAAGGTVVFAGTVATTRHVTILHADGLRTSYSFLAAVAVVAGATVDQGSVVGTAGDVLFFSVRAGDAYLDPAVLLALGGPEVRLVPDAATPRAGPTAAPVTPASVAWLRAGFRPAPGRWPVPG